MKAIKFLSAALVAMAAAACTLNFEEINTNPNTIINGQIKAYNCLEPIIYGMARQEQYYSYYFNNEICQMTAATNSGTRQEHMYNITASNFQSVWDNYARYGYDCKHMIDLAYRDKDDFLKGVGYTLEALCLENLCSIFGDIPVEEAYKGSENLTPAFNTQEEAFNLIIEKLDSANVILAKGPTTTKGSLDGIYGGSAAKWRKFANSLRMRIYLRMTGINASYWNKIQEVLDNQEEYPIFKSASDNATVAFKAEDPYMSYFGNGSRLDKGDFTMRRFTELVIKLMVEKDDQNNTLFKDPRMVIYGVSGGDDKWIGTIAGCTEVEKKAVEKLALAVPNYATSCNLDTPCWLMDYSELLFIEAEGVLKGKLTMGFTAKELYEAAVTEAVNKWIPFNELNSKPRAIKDKDITAFLAEPIASWDLAEEAETAPSTSIYGSREELLASQKWLSLYYVGFEQWNEWRRTEYPRVTIGNGTIYNQYELPTRFQYPTYTASTNPANVQSALSRMGGSNDMHTTLDWSYAKNNGGTHRDPYVEH